MQFILRTDPVFIVFSIIAGMNAAVRSVVRMGIYVGFKVYAIHEVRVIKKIYAIYMI